MKYQPNYYSNHSNCLLGELASKTMPFDNDVNDIETLLLSPVASVYSDYRFNQ